MATHASQYRCCQDCSLLGWDFSLPITSAEEADKMHKPMLHAYHMEGSLAHSFKHPIYMTVEITCW